MTKMGKIDDHIEKLRARLQSVESEADSLRTQIAEAEDSTLPHSLGEKSGKTQEPWEPSGEPWTLQPGEYQRYGRQMIMPEIGLEGQLNLKRAKVLIVGVGGLGCPAARYLAGAGVGVLGLVDDDTVSLSNLHRQILYDERSIGNSKVDSAIQALQLANSVTNYHAHNVRLIPSKAIELFEKYDLILDCTDHPSSRYLISDAAVLAGKPLVTASALRTEGQLMVLNHPRQGHENNQEGFCYRCVFPKPPPPESVMSCGEGGILGPVVGVMGILMAMEAIKVLVPPLRRDNEHSHAGTDIPPFLLMYSAYSTPLFRSVRLKGKRHDCIACSPHATITRATLESGSLDYIAFCGGIRQINALPSHERMTAHEYSLLRRASDPPHVLIDVREPVEFNIAHLPGSLNLPFSLISQRPEESVDQLEEKLEARNVAIGGQLHCICRLGNDSQVAVGKLRDIERLSEGTRFELRGDIKGGLAAWRRDVDGGFPDYGDLAVEGEGE